MRRKEGKQKNPRERTKRRRRRRVSVGSRSLAALKRRNTDEAIVSDRPLSRASSANRLKRGGAGSQ